MSAAFRTVMTEWASPRMNVRDMRVEVYVDNVASTRVFEKFGFVEIARMPEIGYKFGRWLDLTFLQLTLPEKQEVTEHE